MDIRVAGREYLPHLARLLWLNGTPEERRRQSIDAFERDIETWWREHEDSHRALVALLTESDVVGVTWLALVPRPPRPGAGNRFSADIQSVFVVPEQRGKGIGSALVRAATDHAFQHGANRVAVHSGRKAVPLYERLGFASSRQLLQTPPE
jgi:GNAT superfamily N-acetyltransferase